jgi:hypothetical protein
VFSQSPNTTQVWTAKKVNIIAPAIPSAIFELNEMSFRADIFGTQAFQTTTWKDKI